ANPDPNNPTEVLALNGPLAGIAHEAHHYAGYAIIAGVVLHVVGALKHHIIDKDGTLGRMLGAKI
ncbi:MAG: cytochrome b/b6 domain-containing protein, partial [Chromatiales bacterium]|nr:cytochrome b/b6 domain-containing protein [Chromatiales bacterium]